MRAVQLDFRPAARGHIGGGVVMLGAGVAAAIAVLVFHGDLKSETQQLESQAAKLERKARGLAPIAPVLDESRQREIRRANEVIDQLALPWDGLFQSVEGAASDTVALTAIEPDAKSGMVQISAQAADVAAMFDYVRRLGLQQNLSGVQLLQHQHEKQDTVLPIHFMVSASWLPR